MDPFFSSLLIPEERKTIWSELESNPGPLASQATALTTRPWLLGQNPHLVNYTALTIDRLVQGIEFGDEKKTLLLLAQNALGFELITFNIAAP